MNASFDGRPARFSLQSDQLVLIDPLALDGLAAELAAVGEAPAAAQPGMLSDLARHGLRIGLHRVAGFRPGEYQADPHSFESADATGSDPGVFDLDSGTVVLIDLLLLTPVARVLTWDRYDALLQTPLDDDSALGGINAEVGRAGFAIISADASTPLSGDGAFRLKAGQPTRAS